METELDIKKWKWAEGIVDRSGHHLRLTYGKINGDVSDHLTPVALVSAPSGNTFPVQFLLSGATPAELEMVDSAKRELDFYLTEVGGPDPWAYALYHCTTAANLYSSVHWQISTGVLQNWRGEEIQVAWSKGGVIATTHPYDNSIHPKGVQWPPAEIVQKMYRSRQERAYVGFDGLAAKHGLGFYCDLQSLHSEDAITWSVFGALERGEEAQKERWLREFLVLSRLENVSPTGVEVFLWRRVPHPDALGPGGPEIDFGIITHNAVIFGEAKWRSRVGGAQGKKKNKDQIQLRGEFLLKYGHRFFPGKEVFTVVGLSLLSSAFRKTVPEGVEFRQATWEQVCSLPSHPHAEEVKRYYIWKKAYTKTTNKPSEATSQ